MKFTGFLLLPFSVLYGLVVWIRNKMFDLRILPQVSYDMPVISVGNLSAGGTGKTPHVEYLIRLLRKPFPHISTLSRGYGRTTRGYILANQNHNSKAIGDEPRQFQRKFPEIRIAVSECRRTGLEKLREIIPPSDLVILDDAFQHRYVKPGLSILLTDYFQPYFDDYVLPSGNLREFRAGAKRADIIIVTKCPPVLSPITRNNYIEKLRPAPHQKVYFSHIQYGSLTPVYENTPAVARDHKFFSILLFAGIANTYPLEEQLKRSCIDLEIVKFPDHYRYTVNDLRKISQRFISFVGKNKAIVTTEKDLMRLEDPEIAEILQGLPFYYQPIEVDFFKGDKGGFDKQILEYAGKNKNKR
jgi:tetraacyldisaccharide 4'-kinase